MTETSKTDNTPEVELDDATMLEVRKLDMDKGSLLVLKGDADPAVISAIADALKKSNPQWDGVVVSLPAGIDLEKVPRPAAMALYDALKAQFDD